MSRNLNFTIKPLYLNGKTKIRQISKKKGAINVNLDKLTFKKFKRITNYASNFSTITLGFSNHAITQKYDNHQKVIEKSSV